MEVQPAPDSEDATNSDGCVPSSAVVTISKVDFETSEPATPQRVTDHNRPDQFAWMPTVTPKHNESVLNFQPERRMTVQVCPEIASDVDRLLTQDVTWCPTLEEHRSSPQRELKLGFSEIDHSETPTYADELKALIEAEPHAGVAPTQVVDKIEAAAVQSLAADEPSAQLAAGIEELIEVPSPVTPTTSGPTFFDELQGLLSSEPLVPETVAQAQAEERAYNPNASPADVKLIEFAALFKSMNSIKVAGASTSPPADAAEFEEPASQASAAIELEAGQPAPAYLYGPNFHVAHPARYTHCFTHNPLYFEDPNLERCGIGCGYFTTVKSAGAFYLSAVALPWQVIATPPRSCMHSLGDCPHCSEFNTSAYFRDWRW